MRRTVAEIMATKAVDGPRVELDVTRSRPRRQAVQNPYGAPLAARVSTAADAPSLGDSGNDLAQTPGSPNTAVITFADTGTVPPDTMGDVGPTQYLVGVNGRIRSIAKATGLADGVLDATLDAFFVSTFPEGRVIECHGAFERLVGYLPEELIGKTSLELRK